MFSCCRSSKSVRPIMLSNFQSYEIVPDIIPNIPKGKCKVMYGDVEVKEGNLLTRAQVRAAPIMEWTAEEGKLYTVIMTDPDAPSKSFAFLREVEHWLVVNIPGNNIAQGDTLTEYVGSGPPPFTGQHRYVFLVFEQKGKIIDEDHGKIGAGEMKKRIRTRTMAFSDKHGLGMPIAGNFFHCKF